MRRGRGLINSLIDKLPFEAHIPTYSYCGPGTKLEERLARGDPPINKLDEACRVHDIAYSKSSDTRERTKADKILLEEAWKRAKAADSSFKERAAALLTAGMMKAKVMTGSGLRKKRVARKTRKPRVLQIPKLGGALRKRKISSLKVGRKFGGKLKRLDKTKRGGAFYLKQYKSGSGVCQKRKRRTTKKGGAFYLRQYKKN